MFHLYGESSSQFGLRWHLLISDIYHSVSNVAIYWHPPKFEGENEPIFEMLKLELHIAPSNLVMVRCPHVGR